MLYYGLLRPHPAFELRVAAGERGIVRLEFGPEFPEWRDEGELRREDSHELISEASRQLSAYFLGALRRFDLPLDLVGTPFQKRVWQALVAIPYGETRSYSELAREIGAPGAARAVGSANHANPVAIVVPCHRVITAAGRLGGYGGGLPRKQLLLDLESGHKEALSASANG